MLHAKSGRRGIFPLPKPAHVVSINFISLSSKQTAWRFPSRIRETGSTDANGFCVRTAKLICPIQAEAGCYKDGEGGQDAATEGMNTDILIFCVLQILSSGHHVLRPVVLGFLHWESEPLLQIFLRS